LFDTSVSITDAIHCSIWREDVDYVLPLEVCKGKGGVTHKPKAGDKFVCVRKAPHHEGVWRNGDVTPLIPRYYMDVSGELYVPVVLPTESLHMIGGLVGSRTCLEEKKRINLPVTGI
jgi:hypothetical protein